MSDGPASLQAHKATFAGRRSLAALTVAAVATLGVLLWLGNWQLQRLDEKQAFIETLGREAKGPARTHWATTPDFGHVTVSGELMQDKTAFVRVTLPEATGRTKGGLGLYVMTPLRREDGSLVLVNRGFVPTGADGRAPAVATPAGQVALTGFKRGPEQRNWFSVPDDTRNLLFAVRDPAVIADALGIGADRKFFLEAERGAIRNGSAAETFPPGAPQGVDADELLARIPNNHLSYALTWFGLALTLMGVYIALMLSLRRAQASIVPDMAQVPPAQVPPAQVPSPQVHAPQVPAPQVPAPQRPPAQGSLPHGPHGL